jgi:large subunit ribosomal protein L24e
MRKDECEFSNFLMYPGTGIRYVPFAFLSTKPVLPFARPKCLSLYFKKKNPRTVAWTRTFRRLYKKAASEAVTRRRTHKTGRVARAIVGAELSYIQEVRAKHTGTKKEDRTAKGKAVRAEMAERKAAKK